MSKHVRDNGIKRKLRSRAGETISETLVALLIAALALVMLAGAIQAGPTSSKKAETDSTITMRRMRKW